MEDMKKGRITPRWIDSLKENEIFVFGSNLAGMHGGGAARIARLHFGAVMGKGVGLQGQSYAIPTMQGGVETIRPYVEEFIDLCQSSSRASFPGNPNRLRHRRLRSRRHRPIVREGKGDEEHQLAGEFLGGDRVSKPVTIRVKYPQ